jgi:hypothetical protein
MTESSQPETQEEIGVTRVTFHCPRCETTWENPKPEPTVCLCGSHLYRITVIGLVRVPTPKPKQEKMFTVPPDTCHWQVEWRWTRKTQAAYGLTVNDWNIHFTSRDIPNHRDAVNRARYLKRRFPGKSFRVRPTT